jgi:hypothetical protein
VNGSWAQVRRSASVIAGVAGSSVQQPGLETEGAFSTLDSGQDGSHLVRGQHDRQTLRPPRPHSLEAAKVNLQHLLVQEHQRIERLILRAGGHVALHRQVRQELLDFGRAQLARMPLAVEQDELPGPVEVARLGSRRVMPHPEHLTLLVEQPGWPGPGQFAQVDAQDRAIQQFEGRPRRLQRRQRLLRGPHDMFQKPACVRQAQFARMPLAVEQDEGP